MKVILGNLWENNKKGLPFLYLQNGSYSFRRVNIDDLERELIRSEKPSQISGNDPEYIKQFFDPIDEKFIQDYKENGIE